MAYGYNYYWHIVWLGNSSLRPISVTEPGLHLSYQAFAAGSAKISREFSQPLHPHDNFRENIFAKTFAENVEACSTREKIVVRISSQTFRESFRSN